MIRALKAGKQVLCEKPMACNEEEVQAMFEAAKENDCLLVEGNITVLNRSSFIHIFYLYVSNITCITI